jgi:hypothetical protein
MVEMGARDHCLADQFQGRDIPSHAVVVLTARKGTVEASQARVSHVCSNLSIEGLNVTKDILSAIIV